jgi:putative two-component system response regulator
MSATILLVDTDPSNRTDWQTLLQHYGYKVVAASNGDSALHECQRIQPDLVLIGGPLADLTGFEVCRQLKSAPLTRYTPVVMVLPSAAPVDLLSQLADTREAREAGVDDFWGRPGSRWEALNRIQSLLQLKSYIDHQAESVVLSLARSLEAKDPGTEGHSERLVGYAAHFGEGLGLSEDDLEVLRIASLVHDIGKVAVPDSILAKPARLNRIELEVMRQHPIVGESICAPLKSFHDALPAIRHHHEHMDGSGYPDGLVGEQIPLTARIVQIVDIYDALTIDRPYRKAMPQERALAVIMSEAQRGWLDVSLVSEFIGICQTAEFLFPSGQFLHATCPV